LKALSPSSPRLPPTDRRRVAQGRSACAICIKLDGEAEPAFALDATRKGIFREKNASLNPFSTLERPAVNGRAFSCYLPDGFARPRRPADRSIALSNPARLINLCRIAEPGLGRRKLYLAGNCALAADRGRTHIPAIDSAGGSAGRERRSGKRVWELSGWLRPEHIAWPRSGFPWDFERLCHVAINQIRFVRTACDCRICSANGQ
jgi:hypothetical protein